MWRDEDSETDSDDEDMTTSSDDENEQEHGQNPLH